MNWNHIRSQYPALAKRTYLNTAACGLVSKQNCENIQAFWADLSQNGTLHRPQWTQRVETVRQQLAEGLNVEADRLALLPNFTVGLNYAAHLLGESKKILVAEEDFPSVVLPWKLHGHQLSEVKPEANGAIPLEKIEAHFKQEGIEVLAISLVQWHTGYCLPLAELCQLCQRYGVILVLDATQAIGAIPIDLQACPVDMLLASGYKWPTAGFGNSIMYVSEKIWQEGRLPVVGKGSTFFARGEPGSNDDELAPKGMEAGHHDYAGIFALGNGWAELQAIGVENVYQRIQSLANYLYAAVEEAGWKIRSNYDPTFRSGIHALEGTEAMVESLIERGIDVSFRGGGIRVCLHFYNNEADIDRLIAELKWL